MFRSRPPTRCSFMSGAWNWNACWWFSTFRLNLSDRSAPVTTPAGTIIATTDLVGTNWPVDGGLAILPNEGLIIRLN